MFADVYVVSNLDQIVDLRAPFDNSGVDCSTVYRCIGTDLDIIMNDNIAGMRNFYMLLTIPLIAESIRANNGTGMNNDVAPDTGISQNRDMRMNEAMISNRNIFANKTVRGDQGSLTNRYVLFDNGTFINLCTFPA